MNIYKAMFAILNNEHVRVFLVFLAGLYFGFLEAVGFLKRSLADMANDITNSGMDIKIVSSAYREALYEIEQIIIIPKNLFYVIMCLLIIVSVVARKIQKTDVRAKQGK